MGKGSGHPPPKWKYLINDDFIYITLINILNIIVGIHKVMEGS